MNRPKVGRLHNCVVQLAMGFYLTQRGMAQDQYACRLRICTLAPSRRREHWTDLLTNQDRVLRPLTLHESGRIGAFESLLTLPTRPWQCMIRG
jgi:hypothetical protein